MRLPVWLLDLTRFKVSTLPMIIPVLYRQVFFQLKGVLVKTALVALSELVEELVRVSDKVKTVTISQSLTALAVPN